MNDPSHVRSGPSTEVPGPPAAKMAGRPPVLSATRSGHWHFRAAKWSPGASLRVRLGLAAPGPAGAHADPAGGGSYMPARAPARFPAGAAAARGRVRVAGPRRRAAGAARGSCNFEAQPATMPVPAGAPYPGGAAERPACQPARVAMPGGRASARPGGRHLRLEVSSRESRAAGTGRPQPWRLRLFATCADVGFRMPQPAGPFMIRSKAAVHFLPALAARSLAADVVAATEIQPSSMGYHGHARRQDNRRNQVRCAETGRTSTTKCYSEVNGT